MINILLLSCATMIWGFGFVATRWTFDLYSPLWSNGIRYGLAAMVSIVLIGLFFRKVKITHKKALGCGLLLFLGLAAQTIGIAHTTLAKSGFLTALYAVFTPLGMTFFGQQLSKRYWLYLLCAMAGVAMMCELKFSSFNYGDFFILISAILFSGHILMIDLWTKDQPSFVFNLWQCFYMGITGIPLTLLIESMPEITPLFSYNYKTIENPVVGFLFLSLFSSILAFGIQVAVQKKIKAHLVSLIFLTESLFAALFGQLLFNESLSYLGQVGAVMILLSIFLSAQEGRKLEL